MPAPDLEMFPEPASSVFEPKVTKREESVMKLAEPPATTFMRPPTEESNPVIVRLPPDLFLKVAFPLIVSVLLLVVVTKVPLPVAIVHAAKVPPLKLNDARSLARSVPPDPMIKF